MKKLLAAAAAIFCTAAIGVCANALDLSKCEALWDFDTNCILYYDLATRELVAIEYPDGTLVEVSDIPDWNENEPTEESTEDEPWYWYPTEETEEEWWISPDAPYFKQTYAGTWTIDAEVAVDVDWKPESFTVSYKPAGGAWKDAGRYYDFSYYGWNIEYATEMCAKATIENLKANTEYTIRFDFYNSKNGLSPICSAETVVHTETEPEKPELLYEAYSDRIEITASADSRWAADGFQVQKYSTSKKKWVTVLDKGEFSDYNYHDGKKVVSGTYTAKKLTSGTSYKYRVRFFKEINGKRDYFADDTKTIYTLLKPTTLSLAANSKEMTLSWTKVKNADGYEVAVKTVTENDYGAADDFWYWWGWGETGSQIGYYDQSYKSDTIYGISPDQFKKYGTIKGGSKTKITYSKKSANKIYVFRIRAYKKVNGKKIYSEYSNQVTTDSTSAMLNGLKLNAKPNLTDYDLKLVKKAVSECVKPNMSKAEKAAAVYDYVHNIAHYEYDYSKILSDPIEAILVGHAGQCYQYAVTYQAMMKYLGFDIKLVGGKTSSGGPHWWNQVTLCGTDYMIDPQVGGRFVVTYASTGVKIEKVYD